MRSDTDIERQLENFLEDDARPMPQQVLESVLEGVPRHPQVAPKSGRASPWGRYLLAAAATAAAVLALVAAPSLVDQARSLFGDRAGDQEDLHWDAMLQFREEPIQMNPAGDAYGNAVVFTYLQSVGPAHDPGQYIPFTDFEADGVQTWYNPELENLHVGWAPGTDALTLHPWGGGEDIRAVIVAWRSPIEGPVTVIGSVEVDASCGGGIVFSIDKGTGTLETFALAGGRQDFSLTADVVVGDSLYFIVEPGADSSCDTTWLKAQIDA